ISAGPNPNRQWASMTSRPLFIKVAESIVIFAPMFQVGCRMASDTLASFICDLFLVLNGPPDAVSTMRLTSSRRHHADIDVMRCALNRPEEVRLRISEQLASSIHPP